MPSLDDLRLRSIKWLACNSAQTSPSFLGQMRTLGGKNLDGYDNRWSQKNNRNAGPHQGGGAFLVLKRGHIEDARCGKIGRVDHSIAEREKAGKNIAR